MIFAKKPLPPPRLRLVFSPESDNEYRHFEHARDLPFDAIASKFSRRQAWWLADASLLSYWDANIAQQKFRDLGGLQSEPLGHSGTQGYVAWNDSFALVAFRGTEPDSVLDILTDATLPLVPWDVPGEQVHLGFKNALTDVWPRLMNSKPLKKVPVWFTGHSLGAALATLAADRFARERQQHGLAELGGIYTFGSPLVGDRMFVDGFNARHRHRSFRFVNDQDTVTRLPPPQLGYRHVNDERFVGFDDPNVWLDEPLIDHTPRRYAVLAWNGLVEERAVPV